MIGTETARTRAEMKVARASSVSVQALSRQRY